MFADYGHQCEGAGEHTDLGSPRIGAVQAVPAVSDTRGINSGIRVSYRCVCSLGSVLASLAQTDALQKPKGTNVIHGLSVN